MGIDASLQAIADFQKAGVDVAVAVKAMAANPKSISSIVKLIPVIGEIAVLIKDIFKAVPELKDLQSDEAGELTTAFWTACQEIVSAAV